MILHRKLCVIYLFSLSSLYIFELVFSSALGENEEKQNASNSSKAQSELSDSDSDLAVNSSSISISNSSCHGDECPMDGEEEQEPDFSSMTKAQLLEQAMTHGELTKEFGPDFLNDVNVYHEPEAQTPEILPEGLPAIVVSFPRPPPLPDKDIKFFLFTSEKPTVSQQLIAFIDTPWENVDVIKGADTIIICHGFMSDPKTGPGEKLKEEYFKYYKFINRPVNIILLDWSTGAKFWQRHGDTSVFKRIYFPPAANTAGVGFTTKLLIQKLRLRENITLDQVHLIGHSLGAQAMAYAGRMLTEDQDLASALSPDSNTTLEVERKVGRISALDPAAPCFEDGAWLSTFCINKIQGYQHISKNDAQFVDVIHSNTACFGMTDPVGHVDFYPNGGSHQPGCPLIPYMCSTCSHSRSVDLMAASINGDRRDYRGAICPEDHKIGSKACQSTREAKFNFMGHHVYRNLKSHGVFYLETISTPPFSSSI